jgi:diguanylate cyclase (GGDEF)-like protein/PAS domain S-box-containing protein
MDEIAVRSQRLQELVESLTEIVGAAASSETLMQRVVTCAQSLTGATGAVVELLTGEDLAFRMATGSLQSFVGRRVNRGTSLSGLCVDTRKVQWCTDCETDERVNVVACREIGARSLLAVPLVHAGFLLGVLKVVSDVPGAFGADDATMLRLASGMLGSLLGRALLEDENARLSEERARGTQIHAARLQRIVERSADAWLEMDDRGKVRRWNRAAQALFGGDAREGDEHPLDELLVPANASQPPLAQALLARGAPERMTMDLRHRDGHVLSVELACTRTEVDGSVFVDCFLRDATGRMLELDALRRGALYDALTHVGNRRLFTSRLEDALEQAREAGTSVAVAFLDLDGFKAVNDRRGHQAGDAVLVETARRLLSSVRAHDTVARLAGDEFVVVLAPLEHPAEAAEIGARIIAALDAPFQSGGLPLEIRASLGLSVARGEDCDAAGILRAADRAMYRAKAEGGHRLVLG